MTTQATPDFNAELARQTKATENAQALAHDYEERWNRQCATVDALVHANVGLLTRLSETYAHEARVAELAYLRNDLEEARRVNRRLMEDYARLTLERDAWQRRAEGGV